MPDCHSDAVNPANSVLHKPLSGDCSQCHVAHASDATALLAEHPPALCFTCHDATRRELLSMTEQHPPFSRGECMDCHEAHDSPHLGLLVQNERQLCLDCHSGSAEFAGKYMHRPVSEGCVSCHKPHVARVSSLLAQEPPGLCYVCHSGVKHEFAMKSSHPVGSGKMECTGCHSGVHTGDNSALLLATGNSLCRRCHSNEITRLQTTVHGGINCAYCHTPHGSPHLALLKRAGDGNCTVCHQNKSGTYTADGIIYHNHPSGGIHAGQAVYCASCHDFHGPAVTNLLPYDGKDQLCINCHSLDSLRGY